MKFTLDGNCRSYLDENHTKALPSQTSTKKQLVDWVYEWTNRNPTGRMDGAEPEVMVHTTQTNFVNEYQAGYEFKMECAKKEANAETTGNEAPMYEPFLRFVSPKEMGDQLFCFEFSGCLQYKYTNEPRVLAVREWEGGFSVIFHNKFIETNEHKIPHRDPNWERWNPTEYGKRVDKRPPPEKKSRTESH